MMSQGGPLKGERRERKGIGKVAPHMGGHQGRRRIPSATSWRFGEGGGGGGSCFLLQRGDREFNLGTMPVKENWRLPRQTRGMGTCYMYDARREL